MTYMNAQQYLDHRNTRLWNEVSEHFNIALVPSPDETYVLYTIHKEATLYLPSGPPCIDSFTHELLHLLLDKKEIYITSSLIIQFQDPIFEGIIQSDLAEHIGNCLNHVKMLPLYLALGFDREKFISDYNLYKYSEADRLLIEKFFKEPGRIWGIAVNQYLGKFFAMQACPNDKFNYTTDLISLRDLDQQLYDILDTFWKAWEKFDIDVNDPVNNSYHLISFDFITDLKAWVNQKRTEGY